MPNNRRKNQLYDVINLDLDLLISKTTDNKEVNDLLQLVKKEFNEYANLIGEILMEMAGIDPIEIEKTEKKKKGYDA